MKPEVLPTCLRPAYSFVLWTALVLAAYGGVAASAIALVQHFDDSDARTRYTLAPVPEVTACGDGLTSFVGQCPPKLVLDPAFNVGSGSTKILEVKPSETEIYGDLRVHGRVITDADPDHAVAR